MVNSQSYFPIMVNSQTYFPIRLGNMYAVLILWLFSCHECHACPWTSFHYSRIRMIAFVDISDCCVFLHFKGQRYQQWLTLYFLMQKKVHPHMLCDWPSGTEPGMRPRELRDLALRLERDEGWGRLNVIVFFIINIVIITTLLVAWLPETVQSATLITFHLTNC